MELGWVVHWEVARLREADGGCIAPVEVGKADWRSRGTVMEVGSSKRW